MGDGHEALVTKLMIQGLDLLAGAQYGKVVEQFSKDYAIGIFAEAFGDAYKTCEKALKRGCKLLRVQLLWSDSHSFNSSDLKRAKKLAKKYNKLANQFPDADIRLSPFCEHKLSNPDPWLDQIQLQAPQCQIINTPWTGAFSKKYINEIHGTDHKKPSGGYQVSLDGTEATNIDIEAFKTKYADAEVMFFWSCRFNLRWREKDTTPRPIRIKEANERSPTKDYVSSIAYLFTNKGTFNIPQKWLVKSHAEKHDKNDTKGDKLLIISPVKADSVQLKRGNILVAKLNYFGPFDGGGHRYYWQKFGYQAGPDLSVWIGNKRYGTINAGFRGPTYR